MPISVKGNELSLFTDSTIQLLTFYSQSSLAHTTSIETLKLVIEGALLPGDYEPMSSEQRRGLSRYVQAKFNEWPQRACDINVSWFNDNIFRHFTDAIVESQAFKDSTAGFENNAQSLRLSIMKRLGHLVKTQMKSREDVALCLQWSESLNGSILAEEMRNQFIETIQQRIQKLKMNILRETKQENPAMVQLFKELNRVIQISRGDYLFDKIDDAETYLNEALYQLKQSLLQSQLNKTNKALNYFCNHLDLSEEQRQIQQVFSGLYQSIPQLESFARIKVILAAISGEFQLAGENGLSELSQPDLLLEQKISEWKPGTNPLGIARFKSLFVVPYFKPICQLFEYYGIDLENPEESEQLKIQSMFVNTIIQHKIKNCTELPRAKLICLESWLNWYPEQSIAENQNKVTWNIINREWKKFAKNVRRTGTFDGFENLVSSLFNNPVFNFDDGARHCFYMLVNHKMNSKQLEGFSLYIQTHHPEYLLDEAQYWLFSSSDHVLEIIQRTGTDFHILLKNIINGTLGRMFFEFPSCDEHERSHCVNDLFSHEKLIQSFNAKFEAWQPQTNPEDIQSFIEEFIEYYALPLRYNLAWQEFFPQDNLANNDLINDCMHMIYGAITYKIQSEWTKKYPEKLLANRDKVICLTTWTNHYAQNGIADAHAEQTKRLVDNILKDFTIALKAKGGATAHNFMIQDTLDIAPQFKKLISSIRESFIFKSDTQAEDLLYVKVKQYLNDLTTDKEIKPVDIAKIRSAILADKRLSVEREQLPKLSFKHPKQTAHFFKGITATDEIEQKMLMRKLSVDELVTDARKKEKKDSPNSTAGVYNITIRVFN